MYDRGVGTKFPAQLGNTLMYLPAWVGLAVTLTYGQCMTNRVGSYGGTEITKSSAELAVTLMYHQRTTTGVGSYGGMRLQNCQ